jgi:prevent-host-death family protein
MPTIADVRKSISSYARRAGRGEVLIITKHGRPVAALGPVRAGKSRNEDAALYRKAKRALRKQRGKPWTYVQDARDLCR